MDYVSHQRVRSEELELWFFAETFPQFRIRRFDFSFKCRCAAVQQTKTHRLFFLREKLDHVIPTCFFKIPVDKSVEKMDGDRLKLRKSFGF